MHHELRAGANTNAMLRMSLHNNRRTRCYVLLRSLPRPERKVVQLVAVSKVRQASLLDRQHQQGNGHMSDWDRFNEQFRETEAERNERLAARRKAARPATKLLFGECDACGAPNRVLHQCIAYGIETCACALCRGGTLADDIDDLEAELECLRALAEAARPIVLVARLEAALAEARR